MNDYLVPRSIAEALGLVRIRKSTAQGLFLLSESDLLAYGLQKALDEGAIVLSSAGVRVEPETAADEGGGDTPPDNGTVDEGGDTPPEDNGSGNDAGEEGAQTAGDPADGGSSGEQEDSPSEEEETPSEEEETPAEEETNESVGPENNEEESV